MTLNFNLLLHDSNLTGIGEVVLLQPHLPAGNDIRDDVFLWRVLVDSIRPFVDCHYVTTFLIDSTISSLLGEK